MAVSVSIIVPCYNVAPYVDACMDSLVRQTLRDIEIICVNDGSTDGTPVLLHAWEERDSRVRVIDRENGGLSVARNTGMELASGEYIGFVDPDDYVEHSMYARLLEEARRHDAEITGCGYTGFSDGDGMVLEEWCWTPVAGVEEKLQSSVFHEDSVWKRMGVLAWNKLYKKEFLDKYGLRCILSDAACTCKPFGCDTGPALLVPQAEGGRHFTCVGRMWLPLHAGCGAPGPCNGLLEESRLAGFRVGERMGVACLVVLSFETPGACAQAASTFKWGGMGMAARQVPGVVFFGGECGKARKAG